MNRGINDCVDYEDWAMVNPVTGDVYRQDRQGKWYLSPGTIDHWGYRVWNRRRKLHKGHHMVWQVVHGYKPTMDIDHINGDKSDNSISNLRLATRGQNNSNAKLRRDNTTGIKGLHWDGTRSRWTTNVTMDGVQHQKRFINREDAEAWIAAKRDTLHGEYQYDGTTDRK